MLSFRRNVDAATALLPLGAVESTVKSLSDAESAVVRHGLQTLYSLTRRDEGQLLVKIYFLCLSLAGRRAYALCYEFCLRAFCSLTRLVAELGTDLVLNRALKRDLCPFSSL